MKSGIWILTAAMLAGFTGFMLTHGRCDCAASAPSAAHNDHSRLPELEWLRREFSLSEEQYVNVSALHIAYQPTCEDLCEKITASHKKVEALVGTGSAMSAEIKSALREHAALHVACQTAMLTHLYQTAACMSPAQSRHYLDAMIIQVIEMPMEPHSPTGEH